MFFAGTLTGMLSALFVGLFSYTSLGHASIYSEAVNVAVVALIAFGIVGDLVYFVFCKYCRKEYLAQLSQD